MLSLGYTEYGEHKCTSLASSASHVVLPVTQGGDWGFWVCNSASSQPTP